MAVRGLRGRVPSETYFPSPGSRLPTPLNIVTSLTLVRIFGERRATEEIQDARDIAVDACGRSRA
jgi:hypothetical protein